MCEAARLNPALAVVQMRLGVALQESGIWIVRSRISRPRCASSRRSEARETAWVWRFHEKGRGDEAVAVLEAAAKAEPTFFAARFDLGTALMQQGDLERAVAVYRALVEADPGNAEAFYNLGLALKQKDDFAGAETELRHAMRLDSTLPEPPFTLGVVLWQTGRADEAVTLESAKRSRKADYAEAHYMLGVLLKQLGNMNEAIGQFRTAVKYQPQMAEAHLSLAQALQQKGDPAGARAARDEADTLDRRKADAQASTFAVSVGLEKLKAATVQAQSSSFGKPSASRPTIRTPTISSRSRSGSPRPRRRAGTSTTRVASRRTFREPGSRAAECGAAQVGARTAVTRRAPRWRSALSPSSW